MNQNFKFLKNLSYLLIGNLLVASLFFIQAKIVLAQTKETEKDTTQDTKNTTNQISTFIQTTGDTLLLIPRTIQKLSYKAYCALTGLFINSCELATTTYTQNNPITKDTAVEPIVLNQTTAVLPEQNPSASLAQQTTLLSTDTSAKGPLFSEIFSLQNTLSFLYIDQKIAELRQSLSQPLTIIQSSGGGVSSNSIRNLRTNLESQIADISAGASDTDELDEGVINLYFTEGRLNGLSSIAVGNGNTASGDYSSVFGRSNTASADYTSAVGYGNVTVTRNSQVFGRSNFTGTGDGAVAFGILNNQTGATISNSKGLITGTPIATNAGNLSTAVGITNSAAGLRASAVGFQNIASGVSSSASGYYNTASETGSSASGYYNTASEYRASAFGSYNTASGEYSSVFGYFSTASTLNSQVFGRSNFTGTGLASVSMGILNNQTGGTIDAATGAITGSPIAANAGNLSTTVGVNNTASGNRSAAFGYSNTVSGDYSIAVGGNNVANSTVLGVIGALNGAVALGYGNNSTASGYTGSASSAIGISNTASGEGSSAFGSYNIASGNYSSAFGHNNTASGIRSSAFGYDNTASGERSSAFGSYNIASEINSSAFGTGITNNIANSTMIGPSDAAKVTILSSGNVGIGTIAPNYKLDVAGTGYFDGGVDHGVYGTTNSTYNYYAGVYGNSTSSGSGVYGYSAGGYGVIGAGVTGVYGASNSNYGNGVVGLSFHGYGVRGDSGSSYGVAGFSTSGSGVYGNSSSGYGVYGSSNTTYAIYASGDIYTSGTVTELSDERKKDNIQNMQYGLDALMKLRPVEYSWIEKPEQGKQLGLIAQEVLEIMPEIVDIKNDDGKTLGLKYSQFVSVIIKSIQELAEKVENQVVKVFGWMKFNDADELCVDEVCITKDQFKQMLLDQGGTQSTSSVSNSNQDTTDQVDADTPDQLDETSDITPEPEPTPEPDPVPEEPEGENASQTDPVLEGESEQTPASEPEPTPEPESDVEPDPVPEEPDPVKESAPEPEPSPEPESAPSEPVV